MGVRPGRPGPPDRANAAAAPRVIEVAIDRLVIPDGADREALTARVEGAVGQWFAASGSPSAWADGRSIGEIDIGDLDAPASGGGVTHGAPRR